MIERGDRVQKELVKRMKILYTNHHKWLLQASLNITKNMEDAEDLIGDLYLYLMEKGSKQVYYKDSFNLLYCHRFLTTRWVNKVNRNKRMISNDNFIEDSWDLQDEPYPIEEDQRIMEAYEKVQTELHRLSKTRMWTQAQLFSLYHMSDDTMIEVANKIGISKSTTFISIKKIRDYLKQNIQNPFRNN